MAQHKNLTIQSEGFPATIETWNVLNDSIQHALGVTANIIGSNAILSGCSQYSQGNETYVTDGIITVDKQVFSFKGGKKSQGVTVVTEKTSAVYDTNSEAAKEMLPVYEFSYATNAGSGQSTIPWDSFVRVDDLKGINATLKTFKEGLNSVQTDVKELYGDKILKKGISQANLTGTSDWIWINVSLPENNEHDYVISANVVINNKDINDIKSKYSLDIFNKRKSGFSIYVKRLSGAGDNITVEYLAVKHERGLLD